MADPLRSQFTSPPLEHRGAPFWSWNDRLQVSELVRQVHDMQAHGMGGFFMHSREGLETPYLSPEWMQCIRETVQAAQETGMNAWLYDEDRWPSGFAGGRVPAAAPVGNPDAFRAKLLTLEETSTLPEDAAAALAVFAAEINNQQLVSARWVPASGTEQSLLPGETWLVFRREVAKPDEWFNEDAYADNLNPDSVKAFMDITYEAYKKEVGAEFGKTIPGIFTDEPNIFARPAANGRRALPWTDGLLEFFQARRGWNLIEALPWLFYNPAASPARSPAAPPACARARHDYWWSISERFTSAYSEQLGKWCEANNLAFTGHFLYEQEMGFGIRTGGALMPHYRHQHVPGIDMLTEQNREFLTIKQCTSVANQFGRSRVLSETYGCSGWEFTFEGQKWNGDWQYVMGVNLRCQHLALYSLRGCRKRDYPPSFNYNTTWWKYNSVVEDYFARVGLLTSAGKAVRDVLMLHPIATGWSMLAEGEDSTEIVNGYSERLNQFVRAFLATHYDFDFGDEQIMASDGQILGDQIQIGQAAYKLIVIPPETRTLLLSTVKILAEFLAGGGKIIGFDPLPTWVQAESSPQLALLWQHPGVTLVPGLESLSAVLEKHVARRVSLVSSWGQQAAPLLFMQRHLPDGRMAYFVVNNDRTQAFPEISAEFQGSGSLEEWDPLTGAIHQLPAQPVAGRLHFKTSFGPAGSRLFVVNPAAAPLLPQPVESRFSRLAATGRGNERAIYIGPACSFRRTDPNVLTLDKCRFRLKDDDWSDEMDVWRAQQLIREQLGMRQVFYNGLPQRYRWALEPHPADGARVELRFAFAVRTVPVTPVHLLLEGSERCSVTLNGNLVNSTADGWYLDQAIHRIRLPLFQIGQNEIIINVNGYTQYTEIEDCFLIGDFAVSPIREIRSEPPSLHFGDWTSQGYLHYAGGIVYQTSIEYSPTTEAVLVLGETRAVTVAVHVNGEVVGHIPWASANQFNLTPYLVPGTNQLGIEVVGSPRNMLGPLHLATGRQSWTDWRSFRRTDATYTPQYVVTPWGLFGQVKILLSDR